MRRAVFSGALAALLIWSGLGEALLEHCLDTYDHLPLRAGWVFALILCTPFAVFLTVAHALGLLIPPGRPREPILPERLTR